MSYGFLIVGTEPLATFALRLTTIGTPFGELMEYDLAKVGTVQDRLVNLLDRIEQALRQAADTQQQHFVLNDSARIYVQNMAAFAQTLIVRAAEELAILAPALREPISDLHNLHLNVRYSIAAERTGVTEEAIAEAAGAASQRFLEMASDLVAHLEACITRDETIGGKAIAHGPLC